MDSPILTMNQLDSRDVLCSKEATHSSHEGNIIFRNVVRQNVERYRTARTKGEKMRIIKALFIHMKRDYQCRFVRPSSHGGFEELSEVSARDKISHALRFVIKKKYNKKSNHKVRCRSSIPLSTWNSLAITSPPSLESVSSVSSCSTHTNDTTSSETSTSYSDVGGNKSFSPEKFRMEDIRCFSHAMFPTPPPLPPSYDTTSDKFSLGGILLEHVQCSNLGNMRHRRESSFDLFDSQELDALFD
jgi:hypothetical protein